MTRGHPPAYHTWIAKRFPEAPPHPPRSKQEQEGVSSLITVLPRLSELERSRLWSPSGALATLRAFLTGHKVLEGFGGFWVEWEVFVARERPRLSMKETCNTGLVSTRENTKVESTAHSSVVEPTICLRTPPPHKENQNIFLIRAM